MGASNEIFNGEPSAPQPATAVKDALPHLLTGLAKSDLSVLQLQFNSDPPLSGESGKTIEVTEPASIKVIVPDNSTARRFVYAIYRNGLTSYEMDQFLPASITRVRLQPWTKDMGGLLPGTVLLKAWGVDQDDRYGPPVSVLIHIASSSSQEGVVRQ
jgi:lipoprotein-anchoring transpeptidase ErfK/SrfK